MDTTSEFSPVEFKCQLSVDSLVTVHYFEYRSDFFFPGEVHDFWELLYADKGEVEVTAGSAKHLLKKGEIIFHKPLEFHSLLANGVSAPNLIVVSFYSKSKAMEFYEGKIMRLGDSELNLLAKIICEAEAAFDCKLSDPHSRTLPRKLDGLFGSEQLIRNYLEELLILLFRRGEQPDSKARITSNIKEHSDSDVVTRIIDYLESHIGQNLTLDDICRDNFIGRSYLQKIFKARQGSGVIDYFSRLKVEAAKEMIRCGSQNFTQISRDLGFASIHYFSRRFKKLTGMTPTEYASSTRVLTESTKSKVY